MNRFIFCGILSMSMSGIGAPESRGRSPIYEDSSIVAIGQASPPRSPPTPPISPFPPLCSPPTRPISPRSPPVPPAHDSSDRWASLIQLHSLLFQKDEAQSF